MDEITVNAPADFHVHLRQGELSKLVTPHVRKGGFTLAYVMVSSSQTIRGSFGELKRPFALEAQPETSCYNH